jgi:hypothetical protein
MFDILLKFEKNILEINKYCYVNGKGILNFINTIHIQFRYTIV